MSIQNLLPVDDGLGSIGSATKKWATCHFNQGFFDNVGIGTTSASAKLQVETSDDTTIFDPTDTNPPLLEHYLASLRNVYTGGNVAGTFAGIQFNVNGGGTTQNAVGAINLVVEENDQQKASLVFTPSAATNTRPEAMRIDSSGNVGIGTNSPSAKLEVAGDAKINGQLTVTGKTITEEVETVTTSNGVIFEGSAADDNELTLKAGSLTADRVITLPDSTGTVALTSDLNNTSNVTQAAVTQHQSALTITISQITDLKNYLTSYTVTSADVTAHQGSLTITESQITDLKNYLTSYTVTSADVTAHQGSLTITESQISDLGNYLTSVSWNQVGSKPATFAPSSHTLKSHSDVSTSAPSNGQVLKWNGTQWAPAADNSGIGSVSWSDISNKPTAFSPSSHNLNSHSDVVLSTPSDGDALVYNGNNWVNSKPTEPSFFTSDAMLKSEVSEIISSVEKVKSIRGVNFVWNKDAPDDLAGKRDVGVIAQEIQKVVPEAVKKSPEGVLTVAYHKLIPLLIETIKDQEKRIAKLEERS